MVFDINREMASKPSLPCSNDGISSDAKDFRYEDVTLNQTIASAGARLRFLKQVPVFGALARRLYNELRLAGVRRRNRTLARFFKY